MSKDCNPCKECGNKKIEVTGIGSKAYIKCSKCENTRGGFSDRSTLIDVWNEENNIEKELPEAIKSVTNIRFVGEKLEITYELSNGEHLVVEVMTLTNRRINK